MPKRTGRAVEPTTIIDADYEIVSEPPKRRREPVIGDGLAGPQWHQWHWTGKLIYAVGLPVALFFLWRFAHWAGHVFFHSIGLTP